jgi:prepilin-type N-terminal cleavage/methylation domain-containing protein
LKRAGFTLVELLVAVVVAGILTTALARMLVNDSRFVARQEAALSARRTARTALNWLAPELRMVGISGLLGAAPDSVAVLVPYAFGLACDRVGNDHIVSLVPSDSLMWAAAIPAGIAWRRSSGDWVFVSASGVLPSTDSTTCVADSIHAVPGGRLVGVSGLPASPPLRPIPGSISYLYQSVTYRFAASVDLPGRIALWRRVGAGVAEELSAPFDAGSGFGFLTGTSLTALTTPPADLSTVLGLELRLVGASETTPRGASGPSTFPLVAQVQFMNRGN